MIMAKIKTNIDFSKYANIIVQKDLKVIADRIFIPALVAYIDKQRAIDGGSYPALEPETIQRKAGNISKRIFTKKGSIRETVSKTIGKVGLTGFANKTLIETGKLRRSFISVNRGKSTVIVTLNSERKEIGKYLQIDGVGRKNKHFNFFGISREMESKAIDYMKQRIREIIHGRK